MRKQTVNIQCNCGYRFVTAIPAGAIKVNCLRCKTKILISKGSANYSAALSTKQWSSDPSQIESAKRGIKADK